MNTRRFVLRLAVAVVTFLIGWTAATLLGATRPATYVTIPTPRVVVVRDYVTTPRFEHSPCGHEMDHAFELRDRMNHDFELRERRAEDFDAPVPPPPPPPAPVAR